MMKIAFSPPDITEQEINEVMEKILKAIEKDFNAVLRA